MPQVTFAAFIQAAQAGQLVSFPTDTVPALASRPDRAALIFTAKQRPASKPLILMAATIADLWPYVSGTPAEQDQWQQIARRYWPGALTLVLPASDRVPAALNPTDPTTLGVRVPRHPLAQAILQQTGPLATTSANRSGAPALQTLAEIEQQFPIATTLLPSEIQSFSQSQALQPATTMGGAGTPSTVIRWTGSGWETLRQGAIVVDSGLGADLQG